MTPGNVSLDLTERGVDMVAVIAEIERSLIAQALALAGGVKAQAAVLLGLNRTTLVEKLKRLKMVS
jgi:DNA-binding NtrC family response regulator